MTKKVNVSLFLLFFAIFLFFSCDKENINKKLGQYAVSVNYTGREFLELQFEINGKACGNFAIVPAVNPSYIQDCSDLKKPDQLTNVFVLKDVVVGAHTLEIKTVSGRLLKKLDFQMVNKECIFQEVNIAIN